MNDTQSNPADLITHFKEIAALTSQIEIELAAGNINHLLTLLESRKKAISAAGAAGKSPDSAEQKFIQEIIESVTRSDIEVTAKLQQFCEDIKNQLHTIQKSSRIIHQYNEAHLTERGPVIDVRN